MHVVIQVGASADDPVDEPGSDEGHQGGSAQPSGGERASQCDADSDIGLGNFAGKQLAGLTQSASVVRLKVVVHEIFDAETGGNWGGVKFDTVRHVVCSSTQQNTQMTIDSVGIVPCSLGCAWLSLIHAILLYR